MAAASCVPSRGRQAPRSVQKKEFKSFFRTRLSGDSGRAVVSTVSWCWRRLFSGLFSGGQAAAAASHLATPASSSPFPSPRRHRRAGPARAPCPAGASGRAAPVPLSRLSGVGLCHIRRGLIRLSSQVTWFVGGLASADVGGPVVTRPALVSVRALWNPPLAPLVRQRLCLMILRCISVAWHRLVLPGQVVWTEDVA